MYLYPTYKPILIGGHLVWYPWSAISDWAWYRIVRYRTEERRVRHYIGYRNKLLTDIRYPTILFVNSCSAVVGCQIFVMKVLSSNPERNMMSQINLLGSLGNDLSILDIGISDIYLVRYRNGIWCRYRNYSDIVMKGFSPTFFFQYRNKMCWCRMSDTADIKADVDAHLCLFSAELIRFSYEIYVLEIENYICLTDNIYLLYTCKLVHRILGQKCFSDSSRYMYM